jgi:tape measure domain-containing protein
VAYRADIEIAVRGATQITKLQAQINSLSAGIDYINKQALFRGAVVASVANFKDAVSQTERAMRSAAIGTNVQKKSIDAYIQSVAAAEKAEKSLQIAIKKRRQELGISAPSGGGISRGAGGNRVSGAISNAVIGGAFPLLFGQGGGAATGGAIGGLVGGALGGTGGFAGSLLGTLIGGLAAQGGKIKELATDIGFSVEQTRQLQEAFKLAGQDAEKFTAAVQNIRGLGLSLEDQANAIKLVSALTETYGGNIVKVSNAFTSAFESGKVTQATLNQLTSEGILVQDALAAKYGVSRSAILQMAKDGKISVQALADVLVDMGNKGLEAGQKPKTAFEQFQVALNNTATAVGNVASSLLAVLAPAIDAIILKATQALNILTETINTEMLRTRIQSQSGKIVGPAKLREIEQEAMGIAARRFPSEAKGRQLAAGANIISPRAQAEFQIIREQLIRNELQRFGFESGILRTPTAVPNTGIGRITAPAQMAPSGGGGKGKKDSGAEAAAREAARVTEVIRDRMAETEMLRIQGQLQEKISNAEMVKDASLVARLNGEKEILDIQYRYAQALANEKNINAQQAIVQEGLQAIENSRLNTLLKVEEIEAQRTEKYTDLLTKFDREIELAGIKDEAAKKLRQIEFDIIDLRKQGILLTEEEITAYRNRAVAAAGTGTKGPGQKRMEELKAELAELTNLENVAVLAADNMGNAFGQAFQEIINGSSSAQEALANMMRSIGENFINMAAQIIAKQTTMVILGTILKALGVFTGAGGGGGGFSSNAAGFGGSVDAGIPALPNIPDYSGAFRANGGPVSAGSPYVVGEHGPELFVPGRNGSVVSNSGLRDAMGAAPGSSGSPVLNMSFQTTSIGGVEYVSRDQLEAAMAETRRQATRDGANRGMTMTLDRIKQSPQTRSRIGIR